MHRLAGAALMALFAGCASAGGEGPQGPAGPAGSMGPPGVVSATAPVILSSSGDIGIEASSAATSGALSAADWSRFDAKVSGVAAGAGLALSGTPQTPALAVVYGAGANMAVAGNDARLSDARAPVAGSAFYVQNGAAPQNASFDVTGTGRVGGTLDVGGTVTAGSLSVAGSISAASITGAGVGLTGLNAGSLTSGTVSDVRLSGNVPRLDGTNTFSGTNTFAGSLVLPAATAPPATPAAGQVYFETASRTSKYFDGAAWKTVAVASAFGLYTATGAGLAAGATLSISNFTTFPTVTLWAQAAPPQWTNVTGSPSYPVTFDGSTVTVTNASGSTVTLALVAAGQ